MPKPPKAPKPKKDRKLNVDLLCKMAGKETEREVPLPDGTKLEARTANLRRAKVAILLCPPLPPNGNCYAPEVGCLQAALALDGYCTVRFNFRGVGKSTGSTYFRSPQRECEDVRDVCRWLHAYRKHLKEEPLQSVWVAGVSYGSCIGSAAAGLYDEFSGYVAVSYPALAYGAKAAAAAATGASRSSSNAMESLGVSDEVIQEITRTMYGVFFKFAPWLAGSSETNRRGARNAQTVDVAAGVVRNEVELDLVGPTTTTTVCIGVDGEIRAEDALARDAAVTFTSFDVRARFGGESTSPAVTLPLPRPRGWLTTTFCDETMRVSRGGQGGVFVLTRLRDDATASSE